MTKGWQGRQAILTILNGGTDSDILDLGAVERLQGAGTVLTAGSTTTNIVTTSIVQAVNIAQALVVTTDSLKGNGIIFRSNTTTANLRNQKTIITANTTAGVLTVSPALTDSPVTGDVFDITDLMPSKTYRRWDIQVLSPATVTGTVNPFVARLEAGTYYKQFSGGAAIVIPTGTVATPIIPVIGRFLKLVGGAQGQFTHFEVWGTVITLE